jgi:hypothetical protein
LRVLGDDRASALPFPRLRRNNLCQLSAWVHRGIWADLVALDYGRQGAETGISWEMERARQSASQGESKMLKAGSIILSIWSGINFLLAALILTSVVVFNADSPLLAMVFEKSETANLNPRVIESLNTLTILYNSGSVVVSVLVWTIIRNNLVAGEKWAFWLLLFVIGFIEVMAFIASAGVGHARWQVNVVQSALFVVGIGLAGYSIFKQIGGRA